MASKKIAKKRAKIKARQIFKTNIKKPKIQVVKKFANFGGKSTYKAVLASKPKRMRQRKTRRSGRKSRRRY